MMSITKIAAQMVQREYLKKNITLPPKFWNLPEYKPSYRKQMQLASKLIRTYGEEAVQNVIDREEWAFSLAIKKFPEMMEEEANRIKRSKMIQNATKKDPIKIEGIEEAPLFRAPISNERSLLDE
jgi:hypothetical protein